MGTFNQPMESITHRCIINLISPVEIRILLLLYEIQFESSLPSQPRLPPREHQPVPAVSTRSASDCSFGDH